MIEQSPASGSTAASVSLSCTTSNSGRGYCYTIAMPLFHAANRDDEVIMLSVRVS